MNTGNIVWLKIFIEPNFHNYMKIVFMKTIVLSIDIFSTNIEFVQVFQSKYLCFPNIALQGMAMGDNFIKHYSLHPI